MLLVETTTKKPTPCGVGFSDFGEKTQTYLADGVATLFPGLITASGILVLGGLAAVAGGECAPAASSGLAVSTTFFAGEVAALFPGLITASGTLVLGGLAAVVGGECAPAASSGFVTSTGLAASGT